MKASPWVSGVKAMPHIMVVSLGVAVGITLVCIMMMMEDVKMINSWWWALFPLTLALHAVLVVFTIAIVLWGQVARRVCGGVDDDDCDSNFRLDVLFRTAKVCFIGHGYTLLLCVALWLMLAKVQDYPKWPMAYPMIPFIILGFLHIIMAVMFKSPEVNALRSGSLGASYLAHAAAFIIKVDHHFDDETKHPWALVFLPSWLSYALVVCLCMVRGTQLLQTLKDINTPRDDGERSVGSQSGSALVEEVVPQRKMVSDELWILAGLLLWAIGFAASQLMLALRLDGLHKDLPWHIILSPAIVGWVALMVCTASFISKYFSIVAMLLLGALGATIPEDKEPSWPSQKPADREDTPLLQRLLA